MPVFGDYTDPWTLQSAEFPYVDISDVYILQMIVIWNDLVFCSIILKIFNSYFVTTKKL